MNPGAFAVHYPYENYSVGSHIETVFQYDPFDEVSLAGARALLKDTIDPKGRFTRYGIPMLAGGLQLEPISHIVEDWSPMYDDYGKWMQKIKMMLDPANVADWTAYVPNAFPERDDLAEGGENMITIAVCVKQVVDPEAPLSLFQLADDGKSLVPPPGTPPVLSSFDENALEAALRIKDEVSARVIVLSLGNKLAKPVLKKTLAAGADELILLDDDRFADLDGYGTAEALSAAIQKLGLVDLVLCGRQAADTDAGQVGFGIARMLDLPAITPCPEGAGGRGRRSEWSACCPTATRWWKPRCPPRHGEQRDRRAALPAGEGGHRRPEDPADRMDGRRLLAIASHARRCLAPYRPRQVLRPRSSSAMPHDRRRER